MSEQAQSSRYGITIPFDGVPLADVEVGAAVKILRFENEAEDLLHYLRDAGLEPGLEGKVTTISAAAVDGVSSACGVRTGRPHLPRWALGCPR